MVDCMMQVDWNEKATPERNPYAYAKTLAENEVHHIIITAEQCF